MKRSLVSVIVAILVLGVAVFAQASNEGSGDSDGSEKTSKYERKHADHPGGRVKAGKGEHGDPPAWAHRMGPKLDKPLRQELREEWRALSPEERRTLMDKLIREHRKAMREFGRCLDDGRDDCEMPFPPGLARLR